MLVFDSIIDSVRNLVSSYLKDSMVKIKVSYENGYIPNPIKKTYIIINPSGITVVPVTDENGVKAVKTTYRIGLSIHRSETSDPRMLLRLFASIVNAFNESPLYNIDEAVCGEIKSDSDTNSVCLKCTVQFTIIS